MTEYPQPGWFSFSRQWNRLVAGLLGVKNRILQGIDPDSPRYVARIIAAERDFGLYPTGQLSFGLIKHLLNDDLRPPIQDHVILGGHHHTINAHVRDFSESREGGLSFYALKKGYRERQNTDGIKRIVLHWDATLNSENAFKILLRRGLGSHFGINYDGVIYQWLDPGVHVAYHIADDNRHAVGIDINNPVSMKYASRCKRQGYPRPILSQHAFGRSSSKYPEFLGFTEQQLSSLRKLLHVLGTVYQIPIVPPARDSSRWYDPIQFEYSHAAVTDSRRGVFGHLNYAKAAARGKWDPLGLPWDKVV